MEQHGCRGLKEEKGGERIMREGQDGLRGPGEAGCGGTRL